VQLENNQTSHNINQPDMFVAGVDIAEAPQHYIVTELESIQPDDLTPKQALELLYQLKAKL
jgi:DNA mismatch repair protein MutS